MEIKNNKILPNGWYLATKEESDKLYHELILELHRNHVLKNKNVKVIAHRNYATDDILVQDCDKNDQYYVVHLTWIGKEEINEFHPTVEYIGTFYGLKLYEDSFSIVDKNETR